MQQLLRIIVLLTFVTIAKRSSQWYFASKSLTITLARESGALAFRLGEVFYTAWNGSRFNGMDIRSVKRPTQQL